MVSSINICIAFLIIAGVFFIIGWVGFLKKDKHYKTQTLPFLFFTISAFFYSAHNFFLIKYTEEDKGNKACEIINSKPCVDYIYKLTKKEAYYYWRTNEIP